MTGLKLRTLHQPKDKDVMAKKHMPTTNSTPHNHKINPSSLDSQSLNVREERLEKLKQLLPEVFSGGKIDWEKFKVEFDDDINFKDERYILNWAGRTSAFRALQHQSVATLKPDPDESLQFNKTHHIFIEGENLEALKVLQKSYFGRVKMIYIDPPYNIGTDRIYEDTLTENKDDYLKKTGSKDKNGYTIRDEYFKVNSKENGHYHSKWLSMIYPRLFLAHNLLRDDGVLFVSADDNEVHNLKLILNEIFGEQNSEGHIHWRRRHNQPNDPTKMIGLVAEHILVYAKDSQRLKQCGVGKIGLTGSFSNPDNDPRGDWASKPWQTGSGQSGTRYTITTPAGVKHDEEWMGEEKTYQILLNDNRIIFPKSGKGKPRKKYFKSERENEGQCATNWWGHKEFGHNQDAERELTELFGIKQIFSNPKPTRLLKNLMSIANCKKDDIVLDFFAGSSTSAHAVYEFNAENDSNIQFILIQIAENIEQKESAYKAGYRNIAELSKSRIKKAAAKLQQQYGKHTHDLGFKSFKLVRSNFKIWQSQQTEDAKKLLKQMKLFENPILPDSKPNDIIYELIIKSGLDLNVSISRKGKFYMIDDSQMIIIIDKIDPKDIDSIISSKPKKLIVLDSSFNNNDQLKTNTVLQMKDLEIDFRTI